MSRIGPAGIVAATLLLAIALAAVAAPLLAPYDPLAQRIEERLRPPSGGHPLGTDGFGRDIASRLLYAARTSLAIALAAVGTAGIVGVFAGSLSAYLGGWHDLVIGRIVDLLLGFPSLVLAIVIIVSFSPTPASVATAIAITLAPRFARLAHSLTLAVRDEPYVLAARSLGVGRARIVLRHIRPSIAPAVAAQATGYLGTAILTEATLSFLGLGVPPPYPSWGRMLGEGARQFLEAAPWVTVYPGLAISVTVVSFALLGDALGRGRRRRAGTTPGGGGDVRGDPEPGAEGV
jgi:peptide/nickel transport system permease protein